MEVPGAPVWFAEQEQEVLFEITNRRAKGFKVKSRWVRALMKRKVRLIVQRLHYTEQDTELENKNTDNSKQGVDSGD